MRVEGRGWGRGQGACRTGRRGVGGHGLQAWGWGDEQLRSSIETECEGPLETRLGAPRSWTEELTPRPWPAMPQEGAEERVPAPREWVLEKQLAERERGPGARVSEEGQRPHRGLGRSARSWAPGAPVSGPDPLLGLRQPAGHTCLL